MNKKALLILGGIFILIVGTLVFLLFQQYKTKKIATTNQPEIAVKQPQDDKKAATTTPSGNSEVANSTAKVFVNQTVVSPYISASGKLSYLTSSGEIASSEIVASKITNLQVKGVGKTDVDRALWKPNSVSEALLEYRAAGKRRWDYVNTETGKTISLPAQISSIGWLGTSGKIIYIWLDKNNKSALFTANPDNSGFLKIVDMWENDNEIHVSPDGKYILFYRTSNTGQTNAINLATTDGKIFKSIIKEGFNLGVLWAPDSNHFLFNRQDTTTGLKTLWVGDVLGYSAALSIPAQLEKTSWSKDSVFVYVFYTSPDSSTALEKLYIVNTNTKEQQEYNPGVPVSATSLLLDTSENHIYFKNLLDDKLYVMPLHTQE